MFDGTLHNIWIIYYTVTVITNKQINS